MENEHQPYPHCIEYDIVGEDGGYVSVPDIGEAGIEWKVGHFEEIPNIWGDDGDKGDVAAGLEAEDISVDEDR